MICDDGNSVSLIIKLLDVSIKIICLDKFSGPISDFSLLTP